MSLHIAARQSPFDREQYNFARQRHDSARQFDSATLAFFGGHRTQAPIVSENGMRLESRDGSQSDRMGGATELRSYAALSTSTSGDAGGYSVPIGFLAQVLQQMRQYDQLLDASRWIFTPSGNPLNYPGVDDTSTSIDAATLAESARSIRDQTQYLPTMPIRRQQLG